LNAWETKRNDAGASINWMFNVDGAREKLTKAYANLNQSEAGSEVEPNGQN